MRQVNYGSHQRILCAFTLSLFWLECLLLYEYVLITADIDMKLVSVDSVSIYLIYLILESLLCRQYLCINEDKMMKNDVFWDVTPCGSCKNRRFGGT
jgi:hypothetical protein